MDRIKEEMDKITIPDNIKRKRDLGVFKAKSEMPRNKRKWYPVIGVAIPLLILFVSFMYFNKNNPSENPTIRTIEIDYVIDIHNPKAVVNFADNIFVGKVVKQLNTTMNNYPETQFEISVLESIKGNLNEVEFINQIGGYEGKDLVLLENDELLKENNIYLFATINSEENDTKTIIPVGGSIIVENDAEKAEIVKEYKALYKEIN